MKYENLTKEKILKAAYKQFVLGTNAVFNAYHLWNLSPCGVEVVYEHDQWFVMFSNNSRTKTQQKIWENRFQDCESVTYAVVLTNSPTQIEFAEL